MVEKKDNFSEKFSALVDKIGGAAQAANATGKSSRQIQRYCSAEQEPPFSVVAALAEAAGINLAELSDAAANGTLASNGQSFIAIPIMNVEASAGNGSPVEHEGVSDLMRLNEVWLRQTFHVTPNSVTILPVKGDSMEPTIRSGELVLIEKIDPSGRPGDGIYIVRLDGTVAVKRLQSLPGGVIRVSSDNKHFASYDVGPDDTVDFAVLGRVLAGLRAI